MIPLLDRLTTLLTGLPGIGRKTAQRIGLELIMMPVDQVRELAKAMTEARERLGLCRVCFNLSERQLCEVCADPSRDPKTICVVEGPGDVIALERSRCYTGVYHVLGGALSPLDNIGPGDLHMDELFARLDDMPSGEVVIATNPTTEGEATATYLARALASRPGIRVTRIARGLPVGSDLDLADEVTLARALEGRGEFRLDTRHT